MTNAECGMRNAELLGWRRSSIPRFDPRTYTPHSAFRIPHWKSRVHRRKEHLERRPSLAGRIDPDDAAHLVDRPRDDGEAQSRAAARRLGRVKRLEDLLPLVGGHARSRVGDEDERTRRAGRELDPRRAARDRKSVV